VIAERYAQIIEGLYAETVEDRGSVS
jgi:hypothetical protein